MSSHSTVYVANSHIIRLDALRDQDGSYVNDATVTLQSLVDKDGDAVSGVTVPLTMSYVSGSDGRYEGALDESLGISAERWYTATVRAVSGSTQGQWQERLRSAVRRA